MTKRMKLLDYIFILRPTLFFPVWTVFLAGYHANTKFSQEVTHPNNPVLALFLFTLMMGAAFIYNQLVDIETDAKSSPI
ncbi:hypothetical protein B6I21_00295 [candidate division KSB1 bacterium 4572_119]|nr:MAG: hypothetical protein B6I21_00295 [candidate division KSB1 bacterium 4572_119]